MTVEGATRRTPLWPFVLSGMVVGGTAIAVWYSRADGRDGAPASGIVVVGVGMGGGALAGSVVGLVVRAVRD